jgi:DNA-binding GntR family transcriptional regulator
MGAAEAPAAPEEDKKPVAAKPKKTAADSGGYAILSEDEQDALRKKAQEMALKKAKEKAEDDFLKAELAKAEAEQNKKMGLNSNEDMVLHTVNLSSAADRHIINGRHYIHGHTYEVPKSLADCMRDTEFRGQVQEDIRKGNNRNEFGYRERDGIKSGAGVAIT